MPWNGSNQGPRAWGARYQIQSPPALTAECASRRWRELNLLLHSLALLPSEFGGRDSFQPILRLAGAIAGAQRGLLYLKREPGGGPRLMIGFGFAGRIPERLRSVNDMVEAAILTRKPIVVNDPLEDALRNELRLLKTSFCLTVPILMRGAPWGAVQLVRPRPFEEDEAILLWIYALILEGTLPGSMESARLLRSPGISNLKQGLVDREYFDSRLEWEIERSGWIGRPCSLLRLEWLPAEAQPIDAPSPLRSDRALRAIRRSLRPGDLIAPWPGDGLLVSLAERDGSEARRIGQEVTRSLIQSRALRDDEERILTCLRMSVAAYPEHAAQCGDLLEALDATPPERVAPSTI